MTNKTREIRSTRPFRSAFEAFRQHAILIVLIGATLLVGALTVMPWVLSYSIVCVGMFWKNHIAPGTIPEYPGVTLGLNQKFVNELSFGYYEQFPNEYFVLFDNSPKRLKDLSVKDVIKLGMTQKENVMFGDVGYELGELPTMSFAEFKNNRLLTFQARHGRFKFSKTPDGPFFSLPIAFDEYQKMFGKPLRWKREVSGKRVP